MKISEIITEELLERYQYRRRPTSRRYLPKTVAHRAPPQRVIARPATKITPGKNPVLPNSQTTGLNPKVDVTNGHNFKLDNFNLKPEFTDREIEIAMKSRNNDKRVF